jgi:altronate hydrolase
MAKSAGGTTIESRVPLQAMAVRLHALDDVAIAKIELQVGQILLDAKGAEVEVPVRQPIPSGHKVALRRIEAGETVHRYGQVIGLASQAIRPGEHVHIHNLGTGDFAREGATAVDVEAVTLVPVDERRTFQGYRRKDGRVGTRNTIAVISTVNCSAHACLEVARGFGPQRMARYPNVDGVVAFTHHAGCTGRPGSRDQILLRRTLAGIARHPNVGACVLVGLGCETNQVVDMMEVCGLCDLENDRAGCPPALVIQDLGGLRKTVQAGIAAVEDLLPTVNAARRTAQPISELMLALQCGGSDGWSGVTANPVVGRVSDEVVRQGGTVVLAETPEIYGAEHLLTRRARNPEIGEKLLAQVRWWEAYARSTGMLVDDNRSVGNEAGGLTTIYEKSLGAIAKAGSTPLVDVYDYAEPVTARGFTFMNSPGFDPVAVTGQVAGGCNLVLFTTGRGSVFGFKPAPVIKICSNPTTYEWMQDDMDLNAGKILEDVDINEVAAELLDLVIAVASGQPSKSELQGVGEAEFSPWSLGGIL